LHKVLLTQIEALKTYDEGNAADMTVVPGDYDAFSNPRFVPCGASLERDVPGGVADHCYRGRLRGAPCLARQNVLPRYRIGDQVPYRSVTMAVSAR
jgi:hypothetical protein